MLTQRNPGESLRKVAMEVQSFFSSSTIETVIMTLNLPCRTRQGKLKPDGRSLPDLGFHKAAPAQLRQASTHVVQTVAKPGGGIQRIGLPGQQVETLAIVGNDDLKFSAAAGHDDPGAGGGGVLEDV